MAESLSSAIALRLGRPDAQRIVSELCRRSEETGSSLEDITREDPTVRACLSGDELTRAFDPASFLGSTSDWIDRSLASYSEIRSRGDLS